MGNTTRWGIKVRRARRGTAVLATALVAVAAACVPSPVDPGATTTTSTSTTTTTTPVELTPVTDVQLAWAYSGYSQIGVFGPWSQSVSGEHVALATANGQVSSGLAEHAARPFTEVHFENGSGAIDPLTGQGTISWDGSWTLNAYAGQFGAPDETLSDPILEIEADGSGTLSFEGTVTAGLDIDGNPTPATGPSRVDLVTFDSVAELTANGLAVQPEFAGRAYQPAADQAAWQACDGAGGSWPADWIQMVPAALRAHYYTTSCAGLNSNKPPTTVHINWSGIEAGVGVQPTVASTSVVAGTKVGPVGVLGNPDPRHPVAVESRRRRDLGRHRRRDGTHHHGAPRAQRGAAACPRRDRLGRVRRDRTAHGHLRGDRGQHVRLHREDPR